MSKLQELKNEMEYPLLNEFRSKKLGVEYKKLEEVTEIKGRIGFRGYTRKDLRPEGEGAISLSPRNIINNNINYLDNTYISWEKYEESPEIMINEGDVIFCKTASIGKVAIIENLPQRATINPQLVVFKNIKCNNNFLKYIIIGKNFQYNVNKLKGVGTVPSISQEKLGSIEIPIPPLEVQEEIVRILDPLTKDVNELIDLLKREQDLRKKQYAYYRDKLLTFGEDTPKVKLGNIGKISMCRRIMKNETNSVSGVPFYKIGTFGGNPDSYISEELFEEYSSKYPYPKKGYILISTSGTIGKLVVFDGLPAYFQDSNIVWVDNDEDIVLNKYLYHIYKTSPWKITKGGTIARLYNGDIANTEIPLPPLDTQKRIVNILDNLEKYYNNLQESLTVEIEKRKKQYEFYRDKLLTFEKI